MAYYFVPKNLNPGASNCAIKILCGGLSSARWCKKADFPDKLVDALERTINVTENGTYSVELTVGKKILVTEFSVCHLKPNKGFAGGDGSQGAPYLIADCAQFNRIRLDLSSHYRLIANLDFKRDMKNLCWIPIGNYSCREPKINPDIPWDEQDMGYQINYGFTGELDGGGHTISGVTCTQNKARYVGLFGSCGDGAYIHHVKVKNCTFDGGGNYAAGTITGRSENVTIERCFIANSVVEDAMCGGGLVGEAESGSTIKECQFVGKVVSKHTSMANFGGIVGHTGQITIAIEDCCVKADLINCYDGGGIAYGNARTLRCFFSGTVQSTYCSAGIVPYRRGPMPKYCVCAQAQLYHSASDILVEPSTRFISFYNEKGDQTGTKRIEDALLNHCGRITCEDHTLEPLAQPFNYCAPSCILCTQSGQHAPVDGSLRDGTTVLESDVHNPDFYRSHGWDFDTVWEVGNDGLPQIKRF